MRYGLHGQPLGNLRLTRTWWARVLAALEADRLAVRPDVFWGYDTILDNKHLTR
jgi:hypothetical protein